MSEARSTAATAPKPPTAPAPQGAAAPAAANVNSPATGSAAAQEGLWQPLASLRDEMDRMFDNFWRGFGLTAGRTPLRMGATPRLPWRLESSFGAAMPAIDVIEGDKDYRIVVELPGIAPGEVELTMQNDTLSIKGEKKEQRDEKGENYRLSERRFGSFQRSFELPPGVDRDKVEATFDKGIMTVMLPKTAEASSQPRRINIKPAA